MAMSFPPAADSSATAGLVVRSADLVGDSFTLVGAVDRGEGRYPVEELCDAVARTRRLAHRAAPAREHDQIEIDGAESVAEKVRAVSLQMIFDNVKKVAGARLCAAPDDVRRGHISAGQTIRILPDHQFFLQRIRQKNKPLVELGPLSRSKLGGKSSIGMLIDEMEHDGCGLGNDQIAVH